MVYEVVTCSLWAIQGPNISVLLINEQGKTKDLICVTWVIGYVPRRSLTDTITFSVYILVTHCHAVYTIFCDTTQFGWRYDEVFSSLSNQALRHRNHCVQDSPHDASVLPLQSRKSKQQWIFSAKTLFLESAWLVYFRIFVLTQQWTKLKILNKQI